mgnify:FL=1
MGPLVRIEPEGILYTKVKLSDCEEIVEKTIMENEIVERLVYKVEGKPYVKQEDIPFYAKQTRVVLEHCGHIDATSIEEYLGIGGYSGLEKALFEITPEDIIDTITESSLRGRVVEVSQQVKSGHRLKITMPMKNTLFVMAMKATLVLLWIEVLWRATLTE